MIGRKRDQLDFCFPVLKNDILVECSNSVDLQSVVSHSNRLETADLAVILSRDLTKNQFFVEFSSKCEFL